MTDRYAIRRKSDGLWLKSTSWETVGDYFKADRATITWGPKAEATDSERLGSLVALGVLAAKAGLKDGEWGALNLDHPDNTGLA